jgi:hypothetical protein
VDPFVVVIFVDVVGSPIVFGVTLPLFIPRRRPMPEHILHITIVRVESVANHPREGSAFKVGILPGRIFIVTAILTRALLLFAIQARPLAPPLLLRPFIFIFVRAPRGWIDAFRRSVSTTGS